jgi:hypothetical protein
MAFYSISRSAAVAAALQARMCNLWSRAVVLREREDFLVGLRSCGITETTIYPDLDGLAKELVTEYGGLDLPE